MLGKLQLWLYLKTAAVLHDTHLQLQLYFKTAAVFDAHLQLRLNFKTAVGSAVAQW